MRLAWSLAITLGLCFSATGFMRPQDTASPRDSAQSPPPPGSPAETAPPAPEKSPPSAAKAPPGNRSTSKGSAGPATKHHKRPPSPPGDAPRKVVVREGGANEPPAQIVPGMTPDEAIRQRQDAVQWLDSTDAQLKRLATRTLGAPQVETMAQIRNYMKGARSALQEGDVQRANTLALKAHLLSDDLMKH